jgi:ATP-binding cassette, subfamily B, bacterial CvaB/MchF/RaxB
LKRSLAQVLILALTIEAFAVMQPFLLQWVVDHALISGDRDLLTTLAIGFGLLMIFQAAFMAMRGWVLMVLSASLRVQGRASVFTHLQRLPASYFEARTLGDVFSRFGSLEEIQQALTTDLVEAVLDGLLAVITLAIMLVFSPMLTAIVVVAALLYGGLRWALYTPLREASMEAIVWGARRDNHFLESLRAAKTIKLLGGQDHRRAQWLNLVVEKINRDLTAQKLRLLFRISNMLLLGTLGIVIIWLGAELVLSNSFSVGMLLAFVAYKGQFMTRISELIDKATDLRMLRLHTERLSDIVLSEPEKSGQGKSVADVEASIEVRDLR